MLELIVQDRCTGCDACVRVCPMNVLDASPAGPPVIARPDACQTCFLCELYCDADALYVGPDCERRSGLTEADVLGADRLGAYRRDSGWGEWANDPRYANQHWRMDGIFARARAAAAAT
jgi:NAD-dependent dihydropyrimidine dehydrogenase PreA subunit